MENSIGLVVNDILTEKHTTLMIRHFSYALLSYEIMKI